jgi:hypothetical protein
MTKYIDEDGDGVYEPESEEVEPEEVDPEEDDLEEVEPVALDVDEVDPEIEGTEGYPEEVADDNTSG